MRELKQQGKSREKICEVLKVPLFNERSFYRYVNPKNEIDEQGSATCTFNRPFNFIRDPVRVQFETEVVQMFRERSKSRGFPQTMLELCCREVMKKQNFQNDESFSEFKSSTVWTTLYTTLDDKPRPCQNL